MKQFIVHLFVAAAAVWLMAARAASGEQVAADLLRDGTWRKTPVRTVAGLPRFQPLPRVPLSPYGGWARSRQKATGFFRTANIRGRWWLVDPDGCLFLSAGVCSVNDSMFAGGTLRETFGGTRQWAKATGALLKSHGFNTLGCWSDWKAFRDTPHRMPYCPRWNFMSTYKNRRDPKYGARGYPNQCMPVFDPAFETFCDEHAGQLADTKDDPWLLGHFSDNELPFRPDLLKYYLELPESDTGHQAARRWLESRRKSPDKFTRQDTDGFLTYVAGRYYGIVAAAVKRYDPNHLYLGSRIHGRTICEPVFRGATDVDVVSVNYYHRWSAEDERLRNWVTWSGRPFLVSEWYAMRLESADTQTDGAGFRVRSQRDRGLFYQNLVLGLLENPGCVGWHWFKYGGDADGSQRGIVDRHFAAHQDMLDVMKGVNAQMYPLAVWFRMQPPR